MMSCPTDVLNDSFVSHPDLSEYVGLANIERGLHGEPALKKGTAGLSCVLQNLLLHVLTPMLSHVLINVLSTVLPTVTSNLTVSTA